MSHIAQPEASLFIAGRPVEGEGAVLPVLYPYTGEEIASLREASPAQVADACRAAAGAQPAWAALAPVERGRVLIRAAAIIRDRNADLSRLETLDTGKPIQETLVADWESGAAALEFFGGLAAGLTGQMIPLGRDWAYTRREALGVCAGIGAWNYPSQIACWKAAPALVMGNAMVFKPSEETPLGALKLAEILAEAGLPAGIFSVVQGGGQVGAALVGDPHVAKVSLTGSVPTGRRVYAAAAEGMRHVTMELGGKSPLIVFDDADLEDAVGAAVLANFYSSGQICSNGTRVFLQEGIREAFLDRLSQRLGEVKMGDPLDPETQHGPIVSPAQAGKIRAMIAQGQAAGARILCGGPGEGAFVPPTVFTDASDDMVIARDEIFGPVMTTLSFRDEDEVIGRANDTGFGLAAGVFTRDLARGHRVAAALEAGTCWINAYNLTPVEMPFGGVKLSGLGRENSAAAIEHYSQLKSVYVGMGGVEAPY
ncbi:MAG: betaine-aldehyde dehydrogenase [Paracoccus sp. (in: a-proteobacteria)]|jgi:betaine-aldehyde dehydrogenase|uniref:betaine-aldehyde dehydrogenase n=1 Tax=unclassified Paracoccus (in: a-proteobacteria) TaxID=2688777 RepID=UPI000C6C0B30|nr:MULTISPECIES: betaine-aldehyde dehydrogenase [unclassified Paracoccus (in: a-proteobacteria)]MAN57549.1 betaine-aldehyde dehydrogenase [Paracoccus sp. (in: a-proteobacteria)]MDB2551216.1 betaine-aldehyde dehydrogenase [Paracoccus sp. (in: a-proteobacteria)]|tara:strand:+ start:4731 stop:6176 length:1446 start_codon:yes stop_codon:yes gene_type:complete